MAKCSWDFRYLLLAAAIAFIYIQMRLFATQSEYADRVAAAVKSENHCTSQMRLLIDQISMQQGQIVGLEEERKRKDEECRQLRALIQDLERKSIQKSVGKIQVPVAAVVVMACNRADYLERTIKSILKYQTPVASKYPLFVSQDGSNPDVRNKALSYDQLTYMQVITSGHWISCFTHTLLVELLSLKMIWKSLLIFLTILRLDPSSSTVISPLWLFPRGMIMGKNSMFKILINFIAPTSFLVSVGCSLNLHGMNYLLSGQRLTGMIG